MDLIRTGHSCSWNHVHACMLVMSLPSAVATAPDRPLQYRVCLKSQNFIRSVGRCPATVSCSPTRVKPVRDIIHPQRGASRMVVVNVFMTVSDANLNHAYIAVVGTFSTCHHTRPVFFKRGSACSGLIDVRRCDVCTRR